MDRKERNRDRQAGHLILICHTRKIRKQWLAVIGLQAWFIGLVALPYYLPAWVYAWKRRSVEALTRDFLSLPSVYGTNLLVLVRDRYFFLT